MASSDGEQALSEPSGRVLSEVLRAHPHLSLFRKSRSVPSISELADDPPTEPSMMANDERLMTVDDLLQADLPSFSVNDSTLNIPDEGEPEETVPIPSTPKPPSLPTEGPRSILKRQSTVPMASPPKPKETPRTVTFSASTAAVALSPPEVQADNSYGPPFYDQSDNSEVVLLGGSPLEASDPVTPRPAAQFADFLDSEDEDSRSFQRLSPGIGLQMSRAASAPYLMAAVHRPPMRGSRSDAMFLDRLQAAIPTPDGSIEDMRANLSRLSPVKADSGFAPAKAEQEANEEVDEKVAENEASEEEVEAEDADEDDGLPQASFMEESLQYPDVSTTDIPPPSLLEAVKPLPPTPQLSSLTHADSPVPAAPLSPLAHCQALNLRSRTSALSSRSITSISEFGVLSQYSGNDDEGLEILQTPIHRADESIYGTPAKTMDVSMYATPARMGDISIYATPGNTTVYLSPEAEQQQPSPLLSKRVSNQDLKHAPPAQLVAVQDDLIAHHNTQISLLQSLVASLRSDLAARDAELASVREERDAAEQAWEGALEEAEKWDLEYGGRRVDEVKRRQVETLGEELKAEMERLRSEAARAKNLEEERVALLQRVEAAESSKKSAQFDEVNSLRARLEQSLARAEAAESNADRVQELEHRALEAEAALGTERSRFTDLTTELAHAQNRACEAESALRQSQSQANKVDQLGKVIEGLRRDLIAATEDSGNPHRAALARLERDAHAETTARHEAENALVSAQQDSDSLRDENSRLQAEIAFLSRVELENARLREDASGPCCGCAAKAQEADDLRKAWRKAQAESADQGVTIAKLSKAKVALKEDREGLLIALEAKQQEVSLLKRRSSDVHRIKDGRRSSVVPPSTVRASSKTSSRSNAFASLKQLPPTPSIYEETPSRPQLVDRRAAGSALYSVPRRPGSEEKENRAPMLA